MDTKEIRARVGTKVSASEMADMIKSNPIGTGPNDVRVRGGVLSFSFGPNGVTLIDAEIRTPITTARS